MAPFSFHASQLGKRFYRHWIFRNVNIDLKPGDKLLITGPNGSGKSTLIRILAGQLTPTEGDLIMVNGKAKIDPENFYRFISWSGPYMELYDDLTLAEAVKLHFRFRENLLENEKAVIQQLNLEKHSDKQLRNFSSGMLHRVKVGLSIFSRSKMLLLDEAASNMDEENMHYIYDLTRQHLGERILVYASNRPEEFGKFEKRLELSAS